MMVLPAVKREDVQAIDLHYHPKCFHMSGSFSVCIAAQQGTFEHVPSLNRGFAGVAPADYCTSEVLCRGTFAAAVNRN